MPKLAFDRAKCPPLALVANRLAFDRGSSRRVDEDGRLHVLDCPITKATVNDYYGWEIPGWKELGLEPDRKYAMLRDPDELEKALPLFGGIQLLDDHEGVDADNPLEERVAGCVGHGCYFDGVYVRTPQLSVWRQSDIDDIDRDKKRELSASYAYDAVMKPGNYKGLRYDGRMVNIVPNHVALVERGRAGRDVLVSDALPKGQRMKKVAFDRFAKKARRLFANDADIDAQELINLMATSAAAEEKEGEMGAEDDDLNADPDTDMEGDEPAAYDGQLPEAAMEYLRGKLSEDELAELAGCMGAGAKDADPDDDGKEPPAKKEGEDDPKRASDRATVRREVLREVTAFERAKEKVRAHIGPVKLAMDALPGGAATLYRRALDARGVSHKGVRDVVALERMVDMLPGEDQTRANDAAPDAAAPSPLDDVLKGAVRPSRS